MKKGIFVVVILSVLLVVGSVSAESVSNGVSEIEQLARSYEAGELSFLKFRVQVEAKSNAINRQLGENGVRVTVTRTMDAPKKERVRGEYVLDEATKKLFDDAEAAFLDGRRNDVLAILDVLIARAPGEFPKALPSLEKLREGVEEDDFLKVAKNGDELDKYFDFGEKPDMNRQKKETFHALTSDAVQKLFGPPTGEENWAWDMTKDQDVYLSAPLPRWEKTIYDGSKVKIVFHAHPNIATQDDGSVVTFYYANFDVRFKKKYDLDIGAMNARARELANAVIAGSGDVRELATTTSGYERQLQEYLDDNRESCEATMNALFSSAPLDVDKVRESGTFYDGKNFVVFLDREWCESCKDDWSGLNFNYREKSRNFKLAEIYNVPQLEQLEESDRNVLLAQLDQALSSFKQVLERIDAGQARPSELKQVSARVQQVNNRLQDLAHWDWDDIDYSVQEYRGDVGALVGKFVIDVRRERMRQLQYTEWLVNESKIVENNWCEMKKEEWCGEELYCSNVACVSAKGGNEVCVNGQDDDMDGYWDCGDPDCRESDECRGPMPGQGPQEGIMPAPMQDQFFQNGSLPPMQDGVQNFSVMLPLPQNGSVPPMQGEPQPVQVPPPLAPVPLQNESPAPEPVQNLPPATVGAPVQEQVPQVPVQEPVPPQQEVVPPVENNDSNEALTVVTGNAILSLFNPTGFVVKKVEREDIPMEPPQCNPEWCNHPNQACVPEGWCGCAQGYYDCDGDWVNGCESTTQCSPCKSDTDCAQDRCSENKQGIASFACVNHGSYEHKIAEFRLGGMCDFTTKGETHAGVWYDGWGKGLETYHQVKERSPGGDSWCKQQFESALQARREIEQSLTNEFISWYFTGFVNDDAKKFQEQMETIHGVYNILERTTEDLARASACLGKDMPDMTPIAVEFENELGSVKIWEEVRTTSMFGNKQQNVLSPFMQLWIWPPREVLKEFILQGPPEDAFEGKDYIGPPPDAVAEIKRARPVMDVIKKVSDRFGGEAHIALSLQDGDNELQSMVVMVSPEYIFRMQLGSKYAANDIDATVSVDYGFLYEVLSENAKNLGGKDTRVPHWVKERAFEGDVDKAPVLLNMLRKLSNGVLLGDIRVSPVTQYKNIVLSIRDVVGLITKVQQFEQARVQDEKVQEDERKNNMQAQMVRNR